MKEMLPLVERLRAAHPNSLQYFNGSMLLADAADTIERLTRELAAKPDGWCDEHVATAGCPGCIEVEMRRLRAALEGIRARSPQPNSTSAALGVMADEALRGADEDKV